MLKLVILFTIFTISAALPADGSEKFLVTAPNVFRVNVEEDVFVSIFETEEANISVTVRLTNSFGALVATQSVYVTEGTPGIAKFLVDISKFPDGEEIPVVNVEVTSTDGAFPFHGTAMALVTTKNQVVFLQTDKPIYTPDQDVKIKVISLNEEMKPTDRKIRLDIVTPTGAILQREDDLVTESGYITRIYPFSSYPTYGIWSIIASYGQDNEWKSVIEFELREYVLPTFKVKIEGQKQILSTDNALTATVTAKYVYKKDVRGTVQLKMKVIRDGENIGEFPTEGKNLIDGQAIFSINPFEEFGVNWFKQFVKGTLHIEAVVTEKSTGDRENTSISGAKFVESVYNFKRDRTISHFKKGTTFDIKVDLLHSDGSPGSGVQCEVHAYGINPQGDSTKLTGHKEFLLERTSNSLGQVDFRVDVNQNTELINVTIKTLSNEYPKDVQKPYNFILFPTETISGAYLQLRVNPGEIEIADNYEVEVVKSGTAELHGLNYVVVSKGRIVQWLSDVGNALGSQKTIRINIKKDMVPSARLIIFSFADNEVVADSILLDIVEECKSQLIVRVKDNTLGPSDKAHFTIIGAAGSVVNLLAVDEAVYFLKDFHRLTKKKMFQRMANLDLGCGPGGGANSIEIFENAGMLVMSNVKLTSTAKKSDVRAGYGCPTMAERRRKRAVNENGQRTCYDDLKDNKAFCSACEDGLLVIPGKTCEQRIKRFAKRKRLTIPDDIGSPPDVTMLDPIIAVFYNCCIAKQKELNVIAGRLGGGDDVHIEQDERIVRVRTNFEETWISFLEDTIPEGGILEQPYTVPDSITNWIVQASSISASMGMCVADEKEIEVSKDVFLALKMPYSIVRGEQTQVQATLFNYKSDPLGANVYMYGTENVCSESLPGERGERVRLTVPGNDAKTTFFNIIPLKVGSANIEVKAFTSAGTDGIRKAIEVVHEGVERYHTLTILFDPNGELVVESDDDDNIEKDEPLEGEFQIKPSCPRDTANSVQTCTFELSVADVDAIPGTEQCYITFFGDIMSPAVSSLINGFDPFSLFGAPAGCGEQTMMRMSANVYTMVYLSSTPGRLDDEVEKKGYKLIEDSYKRMITFQLKVTGGISVWANAVERGKPPFKDYPPSTWLTAYTIRVFYQVLKLDRHVDKDKLCDAYVFLADRYKEVQPDQGKFYEGYNAIHREMTGGIDGDVMMTAFVVITILGSNPANLEIQPKDCGINYSDKIERAVKYLEANIDTLNSPYARAVVSYTLNIAGSSDKADELWKRLKTEASFEEQTSARHWKMETDTLTIEATSYALLTAVQRNEITYANGIVNWLTVHGNYQQGWGTTSSTGIALEALATYAMETATTSVDMNCKISSTVGGTEDTVTINNQNKDESQRITCKTNGIAVIKCSGQGVAQAQVEVIYNSPASSSEAECDFFIDVEMTEIEDNPPDKEIHKMIINTKYRVLNGQTNMVIVQVGLISGFEPVEETLKALKDKLDILVDHYEISDRKVVLYLSSLTSEITTLEFEVVKAFEIVNPQSAQVAVYDYYSPERKCALFYNPFDDQRQLRKFCADELCQCAAGACPQCIKINNGNLEHTGNDVIPTGNELFNDYACGLDEDKAMDYVFEVFVQAHVERNGFVDLTASVTTVMKMGADSFEDRPDPETPVIRNFVMKTSCTLCKEWKIGQKYLIMGRDGIRYKPEGSNTYLYKYLLDKTSYIEEWAKKGVNKRRAKELRKLKDDLRKGCRL